MAAIATGTAVEGAGQGFMGLLDVLCDLSVPLLAAVNGVAVGLGFTLLAHCDLVVVDGGCPAPRAVRGTRCPGRGGEQLPLPRGDGVAAGGADPPHLRLGRRRRTGRPRSGPTCARPARCSTRPWSWRRVSRRTPVPRPGPSPRSCGRRGATPSSRPTAANSAPSPRCSPARRSGHPGRLRRQAAAGLTCGSASPPRSPTCDLAPAVAGRRGRGARLRLVLVARAHPPPAPRGHPPGARRGRAPRRLQALPRPAGRAGHGGRRDDRASVSAPASCSPPSTTRSSWPSRSPRSTTSRGGRVTLGVGYGWNRAEADDHGVEFARRHDVVARAPARHGGHLVQRRRPSSTASSSTSARRGRGPSPSSAARAHADRRRRQRRRLHRR